MTTEIQNNVTQKMYTDAERKFKKRFTKTTTKRCKTTRETHNYKGVHHKDVKQPQKGTNHPQRVKMITNTQNNHRDTTKNSKIN